MSYVITQIFATGLAILANQNMGGKYKKIRHVRLTCADLTSIVSEAHLNLKWTLEAPKQAVVGQMLDSRSELSRRLAVSDETCNDRYQRSKLVRFHPRGQVPGNEAQ